MNRMNGMLAIIAVGATVGACAPTTISPNWGTSYQQMRAHQALNPTAGEMAIGTVHFVSATVFFLTLAVYSFFIFTKTDPSRPMTPEKKKRNVVYRVSGIVIVVCLAAIAILNLVPPGPIDQLKPVFWLETVASVAFGVSWLVKGETLLKDRTDGRRPVRSL